MGDSNPGSLNKGKQDMPILNCNLSLQMIYVILKSNLLLQIALYDLEWYCIYDVYCIISNMSLI